jgi:hypothetical protein
LFFFLQQRHDRHSLELPPRARHSSVVGGSWETSLH